MFVWDGVVVWCVVGEGLMLCWSHVYSVWLSALDVSIRLLRSYGVLSVYEEMGRLVFCDL